MTATDTYNTSFQIAGRAIGIDSPSYFIADIAANHDGDLERAKDLIRRCRDEGAEAAKFQHFKAEKIVSDYGFRALGGQQGHQSKWDKSVFEVYREAECGRAWTEQLAETAERVGIHFFTSPYDFEAVDLVDPYAAAYKIGSGDITWIEMVEHLAKRGKPTLLASGASTLDEVKRAVEAIVRHNRDVALMQCNTNYTASLDNFKYIHLNVLKTFAAEFPGMVLGLSDHTPGHATVLGAVALGARVIEKHFTDDNDRTGPDHPFSMNPTTWRDMVDRTRELEAALGGSVKKVEENESETVVLQRRCLRLTRDVAAGTALSADDVEPLRPAPVGACEPYRVDEVLGRALACDKVAGDALFPQDLGEARP